MPSTLPAPDRHTEIVQEADRRLRLLMPNVSDAHRATLAEAAAGAVERSKANT